MKPVTEIRQETAEVLGNAVAEVARRAIRPELAPFKESLASLVGNLEEYAETLDEQVRAEKKALDAVNKQLNEVISAGKGHASEAAVTQARLQELQERLDSLASEFARTREEHAATVAALNVLRGEVLGWLRTSSEQAECLTAVLARSETLGLALENQAEAFTEFSSTLLVRVDAGTTEVLSGIAQARADDSREVSDLKSSLEAGLKGQISSAHSGTAVVVGKLDAAVKSVTAAVGSARDASAAEVAALGMAQESRHDAAAAELKALVESIRVDLVKKINAGLTEAVDRLESGNRRAVDDIAGLRATADEKGAALQMELGVVLEKLTARHEDHSHELVKNRQTARRIFSLTVANLFLVFVALVVGGFTLWNAMK